MSDVPAHQFPPELDGHPLLAWMGADCVTLRCPECRRAVCGEHRDDPHGA